MYRVRVKLDWCNIDPDGDQDGKFGDFMENGGQIVDFMLNVKHPTGINGVAGGNGGVKAVYDLQGRKVENPAKGIYIIDGKKVLLK